MPESDDFSFTGKEKKHITPFKGILVRVRM